MVTLVIVESPAKCKKIESFLGKGYKCIASFGHIRDIADGLKGIDIKGNFEPSYRILPSKAKYIKPLRAAVKKLTKLFWRQMMIEKEKLLLGIYVIRSIYLYPLRKELYSMKLQNPPCKKPLKTPL